jgi:hypothetical protein
VSQILFSATLQGQESSAAVDLILPVKNQALQAIATKIAKDSHLNIRTYIGNLPKPEERGNILLVVSDALLPLTQSNSYDAKFALYVNSANFLSTTTPQDKTTAVYSDQPLSRQLVLIKTLFSGQSIQIGMAYKNAYYYEHLLENINNQDAIHLDARQIASADSTRKINQIIQKNQVLLATPEQDLYNPQSIRAILLSSYRHQTPLIGPSQGFVDAGALASVISHTHHYTNEVILMINHFIRSGEIPPPRPPSQFEVKLNYSVARSLGLVLPSEATLLTRMLEQ